jgi:hypothetical protein
LAAASANGLMEQAAGSKLFENGTGFMWGASGSSFVIARTQDNGKTSAAAQTPERLLFPDRND